MSRKTSDLEADKAAKKSLSDSAPDPADASRRALLAGGLAVAGSLAFAGLGQAAAPALSAPDADALRARIKGRVLGPSDADFESLAANVWNKFGPVARRPALICRVADEADVAEAVRFARKNRLKVAVRGGGHNWANPSLRQGGLLIDLGDLTRVVSLDVKARRAVVQPIISNREIQAALNAKGLSYPSGHCPTVKLSGYLLSGGMSWNQAVWGPGTGSVEAVELVTASGEAIVADKERNADYYFAARGAGPGFFGVATRYHLKLVPLPRAIATSSYYYPISEVEAVAGWLESIASSLAPNIELSFFMLRAPAGLAATLPPADAGKVCLVAATIFADSLEEAASSLAPFEACPSMGKCLSKEVAKPSNFEALFDASGAMWPEGRRCHVEAMFTDSPLAEVIGAIKNHFLAAPSPETLVLFAVFTGRGNAQALQGAAFSMSAKYYGGPWTQWTDPSGDEANTAWQEGCLRLLRPFLKGHYVAETDTTSYPAHVRASYTESAWSRLAALRAKHDPDGVFFDYFEGLGR
jgi:FAD/FMN-containing dehydrogenase